MNRAVWPVWFLVACVPAEVCAQQQQWGDLSLRFVYDGEPPAVATFPPWKEQNDFGAIPDESLLVHPKNRGLANVVVYLLPGDQEELRVHPSYDAAAQATVPLQMRGGRFVPHVVLLRTSQTLLQKNEDQVAHHARVDVLKNTPYSILSTKAEETRKYPLEEIAPCRIQCSIHPWMQGYLLVRSNPYMAASDECGRLTIKNLPTGRHVFQLWHEGRGYLSALRIGPASADARGRVTLDVAAGSNDLLEVRVAPAMLERKK